MACGPRKAPVLSPPLRAWIDAHVEPGEFADAGSCVEDAFRRLQEIETPVVAPKRKGEFRRCIMPGFPNYYILHEVRGSGVQILRVRHAARRWPRGFFLA